MAEGHASVVQPAASICAGARVLARHWDDIEAESRRRILNELEAAAGRLHLALLEEERDLQRPNAGLDEALALRCSSF